MSCLLIKCKYFVLCLLYITDTTPWQAICISTTLKYNRSLEKHVLVHFQRTTCSQIYFHFSSYLLCKPLFIRSTTFICNIDHDWMIHRKHPIRSLLTSMLRKANIFKRGCEEIRDRKLLEILKKDRTWLKYELHCNVKTSAPLFFQNNLTFVIQMLINVFPRIFIVWTFFLHISRESNNIYCFCLMIFVLIY